MTTPTAIDSKFPREATEWLSCLHMQAALYRSDSGVSFLKVLVVGRRKCRSHWMGATLRFEAASKQVCVVIAWHSVSNKSWIDVHNISNLATCRLKSAKLTECIAFSSAISSCLEDLAWNCLTSPQRFLAQPPGPEGSLANLQSWA